MAKLVGHMTRSQFGSNLRVVSSGPALGSMLGMKPNLRKNWDFLGE